jgi:hypothetical protein
MKTVAVEPKAGRRIVEVTAQRGKIDFVAFVRDLLTNAYAGAPSSQCEVEAVQARPHRISWARLLKRVFDIDMQHPRTAALQSPRSSRPSPRAFETTMRRSRCTASTRWP